MELVMQAVLLIPSRLHVSTCKFFLGSVNVLCTSMKHNVCAFFMHVKNTFLVMKFGVRLSLISKTLQTLRFLGTSWNAWREGVEIYRILVLIASRKFHLTPELINRHLELHGSGKDGEAFAAIPPSNVAFKFLNKSIRSEVVYVHELQLHTLRWCSLIPRVHSFAYVNRN